MINFNRQCLHKTHAAMDTMTNDVHDTLLQALLVILHFQDGNWEVLTLCHWFETDFLRNYNISWFLNEIWFQI
jgi:hypothetical protein